MGKSLLKSTLVNRHKKSYRQLLFQFLMLSKSLQRKTPFFESCLSNYKFRKLLERPYVSDNSCGKFKQIGLTPAAKYKILLSPVQDPDPLVSDPYSNYGSRVLNFTQIQAFSRYFLQFFICVANPHPHDFCLLDPHPESAFQMRIPDADADP